MSPWVIAPSGGHHLATRFEVVTMGAFVLLCAAGLAIWAKSRPDQLKQITAQSPWRLLVALIVILVVVAVVVVTCGPRSGWWGAKI